MLDGLNFASPAVLWGAVAVALPFLIHWLLRPRPQRVRFPATFLLVQALNEGQKAQRLRNLKLLLIRAAALGFAVLLLAGPSCRQDATAVGNETPIAAVIVFDDSWSTAYTLDDETTLLDAQRDAALDIVRQARGWQPVSIVGLAPAGNGTPIAPTAQLERVEDALRAVRGADPHARTLASALQQAGEWLRVTSQPRRRLYIVSDGAAHAFRDLPQGALSGIDGLEVQVVIGSSLARSNLALTAARTPARIHSATARIPLDITLHAAGIDTEAVVVVRAADRLVLRSDPVQLPADEPVALSFDLPRFPLGLHGLTIDLEPSDRLPFDQQRHVAVHVGPRPSVWLLDPMTADQRDLTFTLLDNLLAPAALPGEEHLVSLQRVAAGRLPAGDEVPALILLRSGVELPEASRTRLRDLAERGAQLVLIPGSNESLEWPGLRRYFCSGAELEQLPSPQPLVWDSDAPLEQRAAAADWSRCTVERRMRMLGPSPGTRTLVRTSDGEPFLVARPFGRGTLYLLTSSPDPRWSTLGTRALGMLAWLLELAAATGDAGLHVAHLSVPGELVSGLAALPDSGSVRLRPPGADDTERVLRMDGGERTIETPGLLEAVLATGNKRLLAANWAAEESDLSRLPAERLARVLGVDEVVYVGDSEEVAETDWTRHLARPAEWFAVLLLILLGLELVFGEWRRAAA